jgi:dTDP-4-amino-4,6-dideoxygalactose transaminase
MGMKERIFLSPPHMGGGELAYVEQAFESNYIAPLGPMVDAFEREFAAYVGIRHCTAVSSGTAAMHLGLRHLGVGPGDEVFASTLTFIGSVTPVVFEGATPVFIDCDRETWNMDVGLLEVELERCAREGRLPRAVIPTDLYGQCCDLGRILAVCDRYGVPVICDSAEAVGARYLSQRRKDAEMSTDYLGYADGWPQIAAKDIENKPDSFTEESCRLGVLAGDTTWLHAGVGAQAAVFSFNGNKIMTTSGGGMLASDDKELIDHARKLSQQARENLPYYEHLEIGYNYRMSNLVAAVGRGQLRVIEERVRRKREIFDGYRAGLDGVPGISFMPEPGWSRSNRWLTTLLITPEEFGADRETVRVALAAENIEARPVWKPMHLQPVFQGAGSGGGGGAGRDRYACRVVGGTVAEDLFERGLCLPSGTAMTNGDVNRVIDIVRNGCARQ